MFETATKKKFRFPFKGQISVEDLWDLTAEQLDSVYKALSREKKTMDEPSLATETNETDSDLEMKIAIVKHIYAVKEDEKKRRLRRAEVLAQKRRLKDLIADKEDEALKNKSIDDLQKMLDSMEE